MNRIVFANPAVWLVCFAFLGVHELRSAEPKPRIAVQFKIEAPEFRDNLAKVLPEVEKELTSDLVNFFNKRYTFYQWTSASDPSQSAALLIVSLARGTRGVPNWDIVLVFAAQIREKGALLNCEKKNPEPTARPPFVLPLYSASENQPTGNWRHLKEDVKNKINSNYLETKMTDGLFDLIPFCRGGKLASRLLVLPLKKSDLEVEVGNKIKLHLCTQLPGEKPASTTISLTVSQDCVSEFCDFIQAGPDKDVYHDRDTLHIDVLKKDYSLSTLFSSSLPSSREFLMHGFNTPQPDTKGPLATSAGAR